MNDDQQPGEQEATAHELVPILDEEASRRGRRAVNSRVIESWYERREATGFPEAAGKRKGTGRHRHPRVWNVTAVLTWYKAWRPSKGGAPQGNQNAVRHGRYIGRRAREGEARAAQQDTGGPDEQRQPAGRGDSGGSQGADGPGPQRRPGRHRGGDPAHHPGVREPEAD